MNVQIDRCTTVDDFVVAQRKSETYLKITKKKINVMFSNYILDHEIKINAAVIKCVQQYIYLGQKISARPDYEKEIKRRMGMGWSAFGRQYNVMKSNLPLSPRRKVYNQCILLILTYESETWRLTIALEQKL